MTTENSRADALTDEQILAIAHRSGSVRMMPSRFLIGFARAILATSPVEQPAAAPIDTDDFEQMTPNQRRALNKGLAALETMADLWAVETRLTDMSERIAAVADEAERAKRIAAMIHLGFVEGAYRHFLDHKDSQPAPSPADERAAFEYDDVVSICDAHGICLPVDCVEMVVDIVKLSGLLAARAESANETAAEGAKPVDALAEVRKQIELIKDGAKHWPRGWSGTAAACDAALLELSRSPAMAVEAVALPQPVLDALRFYANGHHFNIDEVHQQFDTVSGEPQNWLFSERDDDCTMIEDGRIAKAVLQGIAAPFEEPPPPIEGEIFAAPQPAQADAREGLTDELVDTLKLAIGYIGSSIREDRHEHIARIRALLEGCQS